MANKQPIDNETGAVKATLDEREKDYGSYVDQSFIAENLIAIMEREKGWRKFPPTHRQSARMIAVKLARLLNGNPNHVDSWHDIAGYAELARLNCESSEALSQGDSNE